MSFVSYAQNYEDIMLWRALRHVEPGFYIDIGAHDPVNHSVTAAFYERGWSGINVEPVQAYYSALAEARPRDKNLRLAVGVQDGEDPLFVIPNTGLSTLLESLAVNHTASGFKVEEAKIEVQTLARVCRDHARGEIHFLKIDVEGLEQAVLAGADFAAFRPWIVVVEATAPNSQVTTHESWEPILIEAHYRMVWFDGLNRFYLALEHEELATAFSSPPNVFDDFVRHIDAHPVRLPEPHRPGPHSPYFNMTANINDQARIAMTLRCRDADCLPRDDEAGQLLVAPDGTRIQIMHNGLKVVADGYQGNWMTQLIKNARGCHEPQEERVFFEVMRTMSSDATMIELGGYWSFYSLWFLKDAQHRRAVVVEPDLGHLAVGMRNASLNGLSPQFRVGFAAAEAGPPQSFRTEASGTLSLPRLSVAQLITEHGFDTLDLLHCDIQGAEFDVLESCRTLFEQGKIRWVFVSTHSLQITGDPLMHQRCLGLLRDCGATIEVEHDVHESFSGDGLIVARFGPAPPAWDPLEISYNRYSHSLFRNPLHDLAEKQATTFDDRDIVAAGYSCLLHRDAGPDEIAHWQRHLRETREVRSFLDNVLASPERQVRVSPILSPAQFPAKLETRGLRLAIAEDGPLGRAGDVLHSPHDKCVLPGIVRDAVWQQDTFDFVSRHLRRDCGYAVLDVGANIGLFSRQVLTSFRNIARCVCVEPDPENFSYLELNLQNFASKATLINGALGATSARQEFYRDKENFGNYSLQVDSVRDRAHEVIRVDVLATADWAASIEASLGTDRIIWKSDTQGFDELIVSLMPARIWNRVAFAIIELFKIDKPWFDRDVFAERIDRFPNKSIGPTTPATTAEVLDFLSGSDFGHDDLYLWR